MKLLVFVVAFFAVPAVMAQGVNVTDESGSPGDSVAVTLEYVAQNNLRQFQVELSYDPAVLTPQTTTDPDFGEVPDGCLASPGGNWDTSLSACTNPSPGTILITVSTGAPAGSPALDSAVPFGTITFDIDAGAPLGTVFPLPLTVNTAIQSGSTTNNPGLLDTDDGSISTSLPPGQSFYSSDPSVGSTVAFGNVLVGTTTGTQLIEVSNLQTDGTPFDITGASGASGAGANTTITGTVPGGTATVPGDGGATTVDVSFECTPNARGGQSGTLAIENDSDNQGPSAGYDFTCGGLAPMVVVNPTAVGLNIATVPAASDSDTFNVLNDNSDGFSSDTSATVTVGAVTGPAPNPVITAMPLNFGLAAGAAQDVTVECSGDELTAPGTHTADVTVEWDVPGGTEDETVTVSCEVTEERPGYTSDPAPGSTLMFGEVRNGEQSDSQFIDVGNEDSAGTSQAAELDVTGASISGSHAAHFAVIDFAPFTLAPGAANGSGSIEVQCQPQAIGSFTDATLEVESNDADSPHTYPLTCEGVTNATLQSSPTSPGGTLNVGTGTLGSTVERSLIFSNDGTDTLDVSCSFTPDPGGVISADPDPAVFNLDGNETGSIDFTCDLPDEPGTFSGTLSCSTNDPDFPDGVEFSVSCSSRPLVVPTMSTLGLGILALMLLLFGGLAGRRFLVGS